MAIPNRSISAIRWWLWAWLRRVHSGPAGRRPRRAEPHLEPLEDRTVLDAVTVSNLGDVVDGNTASIAALIATPGADGISLREALTAANNTAGADNITFQASLVGTISLTGGQMTISSPVTITGNGAVHTVLDAQQLSRIFDVTNTAGDVTLNGLTLRNGRTTAIGEAGGAIRFASNSALTITNSTLSGNSTTGNSSSGGAIHVNSGALTLRNSTLSGNSTTGTSADGGAIHAVFGSVTLSNSTLSGNYTAGNSDYGGGAISSLFATVTMSNSTVAFNTAATGRGGGIFCYGALVSMNNSIVARNTDNGTAPDLRSVNIAPTVRGSLIGTNTGTGLAASPPPTADGNGNFIGGAGASAIDPLLGPLALNGGTTPTHVLLAGSPAIDRGDNTLIPADVLDLDGDGNTTEPLPFDQRRAPFARISGGTVDMGAVERQTVAGLSLVVDTAVDENDGNHGAGDLSLREAVGLANGSAGASTITFAASLNGQPLNLALGQMVITETVTITGNGAANSILDAQQLSRIFDVMSSAGNVTLDGLTLRDGRTANESEHGGAIRFLSNGTLTVANSTLSGNSTAGGSAFGGAISSDTGGVMVINSTLSGNFTTGGEAVGGAIASVSGGVLVSNSILTGNSTGEDLADGGAIFSRSAVVTVKNSTLSGNFTTGFRASGGAIASDSGMVTVGNSTLSGNYTTGYSAGGGAIRSGSGAVTVSNSTVAFNQSGNGAGGGIYSSSGPMTVTNSIVAKNTDNGSAPDLKPAIGQPLTVRSSLIGNNTGTGLAAAPLPTPGANGNFIGGAGASAIDPMLRPLAFNGGATRTHLLLAGSPAIDRGDNTLIAADAFDLDGDGNTAEPLPFDQRRAPFVRVFNDTVDMGAIERQTVAGLSLVVDTAVDEDDGNNAPGDLSLREAINLANASVGPNTVSFAAALNGQALNLTLGQLTINETATITGNGAANTVLDAQRLSRIFDLTDTAGDVALDSLTLRNGQSTNAGGDLFNGGGAIRFRSNGTLSVKNSTLSGNSSVGAVGGAIYTISGAVAVTSSTLSENSTAGESGRGGAISSIVGAVTVTNSILSGNFTAGNAAGGGAIESVMAPVTVINSTLSSNSTAGTNAGGGALFSSSGALTVINSTLSGNSTMGTNARGAALFSQFGLVTVSNSTVVFNVARNAGGGGIFSAEAPVTLTNSIIAQNTDVGIAPDLRPSPDGLNDPLVVRNSLIGSGTGTGLLVAPPPTPDANGNFIGGAGASAIDPLLGPLVFNGGLTPTHPLLAGSPAIDRGSNALVSLDDFDLDGDGNTAEAISFDQRRAPFVRVSNGMVDMGAVERQTVAGLPLVVDTAVDENDGNYGPGDLSLREAVGLANGSVGADSITFTAALNSQALNLTLGQLTVSEAVTITGNGAANTIIDAQRASRILDIASTAGNVTLDSLTLRNGRTTANSAAGGAIRSASNGTLAVSNSALFGNSTEGNLAPGGAIASTSGAVAVSNSTLSGNSTAGGLARGGAIFSQLGAVTVSNSTLSGNATAQVEAEGGALFAFSGAVSVSSSTVAFNQAASAAGGGIFSASAAVTVHNSIIARNTDDGTAPDLRPSPDVDDPLIVRSSLIGVNTGTGLAPAPLPTPDANGNFIGTQAARVNPLLGTLLNNGGPTFTHALQAGSPAIDRGSDVLAVGLVNDQRGAGFTRFTGTVDMGAFEVQAPPPSPPAAPPPRVVQVVKQRVKKRTRVEVLVNGVVVKSIFPFGGFTGAVTVRGVELNGDGLLDVQATARINGRKKTKTFFT